MNQQGGMEIRCGSSLTTYSFHLCYCCNLLFILEPFCFFFSLLQLFLYLFALGIHPFDSSLYPATLLYLKGFKVEGPTYRLIFHCGVYCECVSLEVQGFYCITFFFSAASNPISTALDSSITNSLKALDNDNTKC